ncbi:MAG: suppressor of fused domain protein [Deltaproteobacteria bacterium]|nr:suppressor of fused domain protein [Deltaproteobacteria bacterium]
MDQDTKVPGWDAIDAALRKLYGDVQPLHWTPSLHAEIGGDDFLQGVSAYRSTFGGRAHWHFVTYGFSELYDKETEDPNVSGFGFEMTVRVLDPDFDDKPPTWVMSMLQNLARYVFRTGNVFEPGHYTTLNGPIALGRKTELVAAAFVADPQLPEMNTVNGKVKFVQLVGLTQNEYDAIRDWDSEKFLLAAAKRDAAMLTVLDRASWLADKDFKRIAEEGAARDGSSMGAVFTTKGGFERELTGAVLGVAANTIEDIRRVVRRRLEFGRETRLAGPEGVVMLAAAKQTELSTSAEGEARIAFSPEDRKAILAIPVKRGDYPLPSGKLIIRVIPIEILDGERKNVIEVIG